MVREPYYTSTPSSVKPANSRCYSFASDDVALVTNPAVVVPPVSAGKLIGRSNSIEPYYEKTRKIGTLPPTIQGLFKYNFETTRYKHKLQDNECAIVSDDDTDDAFYDTNFIKPPSHHATLSRKISDNFSYNNSSDEDDPVFDLRILKPAQSAGLYPTEPPHLYDLGDVRQAMRERSDNPNILMNPVARRLSLTVVPPALTSVSLVSDNYDVDIKHQLRDDYDVPAPIYMI